MHYDNPNMTEGMIVRFSNGTTVVTVSIINFQQFVANSYFLQWFAVISLAQGSCYFLNSGVIDNSGMRFYYTTERPAQEAGAISLGHAVVGSMIVPPGARNFTITGICPSDCTQV